MAVQVESRRLSLAFRDRLPEVALREFSPLGERDFRKLLFFFDSKNEPLLRADAVVWAHRERLRRALIVCAVAWGLPSVVIGAVVIAGVLSQALR